MDCCVTETFGLFQRIKYKTPPLKTSSHFHNHHELYYMNSGATTYFVENRIYVLQPGDMVFIPKGEYHQTNYQNIVGIERFLLNFDDAFLGADYRIYMKSLYKHNHIRLPEQPRREALELLLKIEKECKEENPYHTELCKLYLRQLLILIARYNRRKTAPNLPGTKRIIQQAVTHICQNYARDLTLETLAKQYALSSGYFSKQFKQITGISLTEYVNMIRVNEACKLLEENPNRKIIDVAME